MEGRYEYWKIIMNGTKKNRLMCDHWKLFKGEAEVLGEVIVVPVCVVSVLCMLIDLPWLTSYKNLEAFGNKCHWATALKGGIFGYLIGIWYNYIAIGMRIITLYSSSLWWLCASKVQVCLFFCSINSVLGCDNMYHLHIEAQRRYLTISERICKKKRPLATDEVALLLVTSFFSALCQHNA